MISQTSESRLYLDNLNQELIAKWNKIQIPPEYSLVIVEVIEEEFLNELCEFYDFLNNNTTIENNNEIPTNYLPENRRFDENLYKQLGSTWLTLVLKNNNNRIIGLTEMIFDPKEPHRIRQNLTGIDPKYRGNGYGRLIKVKLIGLVKEKYADLKYIYTGNNITNQSILNINNKLGYKTENIVYNYIIDL